MISRQSRHIGALGTLLLGIVLVVSPVLKVFAGSCPRQGRKATETGPVAGSVIPSASAFLHISSPECPCPNVSDAHIGNAVSVEMGRWTIEVGPTPSGVEGQRPPPLVRARTMLERTPPDPVIGTCPGRTVALQM